MPAQSPVRRFDLLLVLGYFRSATAYLSIIRHLSRELSIAVLVTDADASLTQKTGKTKAVFTRLCGEFGAEILELPVRVHARLVIVQQFPYEDALARQIRDAVSGDRYVGLMALATAGLHEHDRFLQQFDIQKVYVPSRRFMEFLLRNRANPNPYRGVAVEEVGLPYRRHPVFPEFSADWLIAAPTLFSFSNESGKHAFLETVLRLLSQVPASDVVVYKPHNGNALDYFAPRFHYMLAAVIRRWSYGIPFLRWLNVRARTGTRKHLERILTGILHQAVLDRARRLSEVTPYAEIGLEAFLPGVRKGIIGGLSNTIWGTYYFGLPFFNCVDPNLVQHRRSELLKKRSDMLLGLNLEYFGAPFCNGNLSSGFRGESIVREEDRAGDLIQAVQRDLDGCNQTAPEKASNSFVWR